MLSSVMNDVTFLLLGWASFGWLSWRPFIITMKAVWPYWTKFHGLGYFLLNQFLPKQAVLIDVLFLGILRFQNSFNVKRKKALRQRFWPLFLKFRQNFIQVSGHTELWKPPRKLRCRTLAKCNKRNLQFVICNL